MAKLSIKWGPRTEIFELLNDVTTVGRGNDNHLQLKDIKISRRHCQIVKISDGYKIADLSSSNGFQVNHQKTREATLKDKDIIKVGNVEITFIAEMVPVAATPDATVKSGTAPPVPPPVQSLSLSAPESESRMDDASPGEQLGQATTPIPKIEPLPLDDDLLVPPENEEHPNVEPPAAPQPEAPAPAPVKAQKPTPPVKKPPFSSPNENNTTDKKAAVITRKKPGVAGGSKYSKLSKLSGRKSGPSKLGDLLKKTTAGKSKYSKMGQMLSKKNKEKAGEPEADRQPAEATSGGKKNTLFMVIGGAALLLIIGGVILAFSSSSNARTSSSLKEKKLWKQAIAAEKERDWAKAQILYADFIKKFKKSKLKKKAEENLDRVEQRRRNERSASREIGELLKKKEDYHVDQYGDLLKEFERFMDKYGDTQAVEHARGAMDNIRRIVSANQSLGLDAAFNDTRHLVEDYIQKKDYESALTKWQEFEQKYPNLDSIQKNLIKKQVKNIKKLMGKE